MTILSWASVLLLVSALTVVGCAGPYSGTGAYSPGYGGNYYAPPPQNLYATPWVGPNTPWVYYQGDWFLNGMLYYFYGNRYGWAPYYAYPVTYVVRPGNWYGPRWNTWYQQHPQHWQNLTQRYPYWRNHRSGQHYDQNFYNRYHHSQGSGWQKGFHGRAVERPQPEVRRPGPAQMAPRQGQGPGPARMAPPEGQRPGPARVAPEGQRPGPARVAPPEGRKPGPARVAPEGQRPSPARVAPSAGQRPGPTQVTPPQGQRPGPVRGAQPEGRKPAPATGKKAPAGKPEKTGPGEEKH